MQQEVWSIAHDPFACLARIPWAASTVAAMAVLNSWDVVSVAVQVSSKSITSIPTEGAELTPGCALKKSTSICIAFL